MSKQTITVEVTESPESLGHKFYAVAQCFTPGRTRPREYGFGDTYSEAAAQAVTDIMDKLAEDERAADTENAECEGHPAGEFDPMGETVYCDGSCR